MIDYYDAAFDQSRFLLKITGFRFFKTNIKPLIVFWYIVISYMFYLTCISFMYDKTFMDIVDIIITMCFCFHAIIRMTTFLANENELQDLWRAMVKNFWEIEKCNPKLQTSCFAILKYFRRFQNVFLCHAFLTWSLLVFHGFATGERPLHFHRPEIFPEVLFTCVIGGVFAFFTCIVVGTDFFFLTLVINTQIQYKILNQTARNCLLNTEDGRECRANIKDCMKQYNFLSERVIGKINKIFGPMLLLYIWIITIMIGNIMYAFYDRTSNAKLLDFAKYIVMIVSCAMELVAFYVIPSQLLTNEMNQLFDDVYDLDWYKCQFPTIKKSLLIMLTNKRIIAAVSVAGKLIDLNFETCTSMFRICFSTFTFLTHMRKS